MPDPRSSHSSRQALVRRHRIAGVATTEGANWPAISGRAKRDSQRAQQMLRVTPRAIVVPEEPLPDSKTEPRGAMGVLLAPGRSIAVDAQSAP
jgi:membrane-bound lytic murein transglycosylase